jgi:ABC-type amino acid transport substrate-binding protein
VATGIVPEQELFAYEKAEDAVRDLRQDRVDVVLLDEAVAGSYTSDGALAIVGEGAVAELYAVALAKDTGCMKARINTALAALAAAGVIDDLAEYFNVALVPSRARPFLLRRPRPRR